MSYYCESCQSFIESEASELDLHDEEETPSCPLCHSHHVVKCQAKSNWDELLIIQFFVLIMWACFLYVWLDNGPLAIIISSGAWLMLYYGIHRLLKNQAHVLKTC
ncbi:hypothetical protein HR060_04565 [Catenovulum sp. SM1970]|uniref:hypothetical protein n=1 Tax=Marinifaba aquimaris TaxID=2741323 RepID=UPI0015745D46|nr:hypothetical protein [Marinifaba aquimaris]NTS76135.1 hypothetical protein [Marinifaba aquimaris]